MAVQLITYDLRKPGQDYRRLHDAIRALGDARHCLESVWLLKTGLTSTQVRDTLKAYYDANDKVLVAALGGDWATYNVGEACTQWMYAYLGR